MTSILYLIGISITLGGCGLLAFLWSLRTGQYDDMEGAANRILFDDEPAVEHRVAQPTRIASPLS
jgi:cbb3-type cytochrome oxidase maturation protein